METRHTDYLNRPHEAVTDARILSLVPSLTELVFDLGLQSKLVGRTQYCIHPAAGIEAVPSVGGTKKIKMDRVRQLAPTHALLNVDENPKDMARDLEAMGIEVIVTHPMHPDDNIPLYRLIGGIFGASDAVSDLIDAFTAARSRLDGARTRPRRRALYLIWKDPWLAISADTYIANMLSLVNWHAVTLGAQHDLVGDAARYPEIIMNDAVLEDVDLVLFSTEPYAFDRATIDWFQETYPSYADKAHLIDGEMTSWYGSRAIRGLDYLGVFAEAVNK